MGDHKSIRKLDLKIIVRHVRKMISTPDPLSILVRGMTLVDETLADLIDTYSPIPYSKIDEEFRHPSLMQKATFACALGAISEGELASIRCMNKIRNNLAHRIPIEVTADDEEIVVNVLGNQTKLFRGLNYKKADFPKTFIFILVVLFYYLSLRCGRPDVMIRHVPDDSNIEAIGAIALTKVLIRVATQRTELSDDQITKLIQDEVNEAKSLRDQLTAEEAD